MVLRRVLACTLILVLPVSAAEPPKITVSKETTYITEPLGEDGLPDYRRAMLEQMRKGKVLPEENGAVLFWQTVGLDSIEKKYHEAFCRELGMDPPKEDGKLQLVNDVEVIHALTVWVLQDRGFEVDAATYKAFEQENPAAVSQANEQAYDLAYSYVPGAWRLEPVAPLVTWVQTNNKALDQIAESTRRKLWYDPPPGLCGEELNSMTDWIRPMVHRDVAQSLAVRAMIRIQNDDFEAAQSDIDAIHRMSRSYPRDTMVDVLIGTALRTRVAMPVELTLVERPNVPSDVLRAMMRNHQPRNMPSRLPELLRGRERLVGLQFLVELSRGDEEARKLIGMGLFMDDRAAQSYEWLLSEPSVESLDWNRVLQVTNAAYDFTAKKAEKTAVQGIEKAFEDYCEKLTSETHFPSTRDETIRLSPEERTQLLATCIVQSLCTSFAILPVAEARHATTDRLLYVSLALALHRTEHGDYPQSLNKLVPEVLDQLPVDAYGNDRLGYRRTAKGYLLYSFGLNGKDDDGCCNGLNIFQGYTAGEDDAQLRKLLGRDVPGRGILKGYIPIQADDVAIRLPLPKIEVDAEP